MIKNAICCELVGSRASLACVQMVALDGTRVCDMKGGIVRLGATVVLNYELARLCRGWIWHRS